MTKRNSKGSTTNDKAYAVGYGRPPAAHHFQKGKSGNPAGRPKGARSLQTLLLEELERTVPIREGEKVRKVTKREALVAGVIHRALKGDPRTTLLVFQLVDRMAASSVAAIEEGLSDNDQAILDAFMSRRRKLSGGDS